MQDLEADTVVEGLEDQLHTRTSTLVVHWEHQTDAWGPRGLLASVWWVSFALCESSEDWLRFGVLSAC